MRFRPCTLVLASILCAACGKADAGSPDSGIPSRRPADPKAAAAWDQPARCGLSAYQWIDSPEIGTVVAWEEMSDYQLTPQGITSLLDSSGFHIARPLTYKTRVYRYRYRTQDRGVETQATAMLGLPDVPSRPAFPVLLFLHGTSGFNDKCAPSRDFLNPFMVAALVSFGYVVVAPDYLGMNGMGAPATQLHPYVVAEPTAIASLDAVRAARELLEGKLRSRVAADPGILVLGGSQGGHSALMVARYGPYYSPEENVIAVAASVPPADLVAETQRDTNVAVGGSANVAAIITAHADWYHADLSAMLVPPFDTSIPQDMRQQCEVGSLVRGATQVGQVFTGSARSSAAAGLVDDSPLSCMLRRSSLPQMPLERLSNAPTLFVLSELDELVATPLERLAFDALCAQGMALEYLECAGAGHTAGAVGSLSEQLDFLDARRKGEPWPAEKQCQRSAPVVCSGTAK